ncbi:substrate-binding domain-containing protein [Vibrio comitans]|uniref:LacI family transcriptional regulator n=1 Tax=Vibrio comitans NBRC 102076 TaxID=1219078 RepID=A0A4Y3IQS0_9VIBR|nr:substrate-binding domain-containing protein [Vibrio comitans]GEA61214.1 LacI family transcriptional regulator [Vibrio comitans NBRC 102076]
MNIKDVAALSGVSPSTVSRYLNQPVSVAKGTAEKIERVIALTGYNAAKQDKKVEMSKNPTIGVVISSLLNPVFSEVVAGIQRRAQHFGYSTIVIDTQYNSEQEMQAVADLIRLRVEGVVMTVANSANNRALAVLKDFNFPYCLVHNQSTQAPCVYVDNYQAGRDVALKLIELGHQKVGMITGSFQSSDRAKKRYQGFRDGLVEQGIQLSDLLEVDQNKLDSFGKQETQVMTADDAPTAWFCSNDLLALKAINAARELELNVPSDVSIIGFDGMSLAQLITPGLATVSVPHLRMGQVAVDILFNAKAGSKLATSLAMEYELQMNGSLGAAPKSRFNEQALIGE